MAARSRQGSPPLNPRSGRKSGTVKNEGKLVSDSQYNQSVRVRFLFFVVYSHWVLLGPDLYNAWLPPVRGRADCSVPFTWTPDRERGTLSGWSFARCDMI